MIIMNKDKPMFMIREKCKKCGSTLIRINWMSYDGIKIEHLDIYCGVCESFITHVDVSPYEE